MNVGELAQELRDENYREEIIATVVAMYALELNKEIKPRHMSKKDSFTPELKNTCKKVLWATPSDDFNTAWILSQCVYDYELTHSMDGMGGCVAKSFTRLFAEYVAKGENKND